MPHTEPAADDLRVVLPELANQDVGVALAAFAALRSFAFVCRRGAYRRLPPSLWSLPTTLPAVEPCLSAEQVGTRLAASALVCDFPHPSFRNALSARLEDPVFTVRWRATLALARDGATSRSLLIEALSRSTPRQLDRDRYRDYFDALDAMGIGPDELTAQR